MPRALTPWSPMPWRRLRPRPRWPSSSKPGWHTPPTAHRSPSPIAKSAHSRRRRAKKVGARVGLARGRINEALKAREEQVKADELARILVEERVDVTLPVQTLPYGAVHPIPALMALMEDVFVAMGWG